MKRLTKTDGGCFKYSDTGKVGWACDYTDAGGKRCRKQGFSTKYEARRFHLEHHQPFVTHPEIKSVTVGELAKAWMERKQADALYAGWKDAVSRVISKR